MPTGNPHGQEHYVFAIRNTLGYLCKSYRKDLSEPERSALTRANRRAKFTYAIDARSDSVPGFDSRSFGTASGNNVARMQREIVAVERNQIERTRLHMVHEVTRADRVVVLRHHFERIDVRHFVAGNDHRPEA